jgi:hypothetical protein
MTSDFHREKRLTVHYRFQAKPKSLSGWNRYCGIEADRPLGALQNEKAPARGSARAGLFHRPTNHEHE